MQAVILSFDSLAANSLGCYGNEWVETPNWDRFAVSGTVFDQHFADTVGHKSGMVWANGRHTRSTSLLSAASLGRTLKSVGVSSQLIVANQQRDWPRSVEADVLLHVQGRDGIDVQPHEVPIAELVKAGLSTWNDPVFQRRPRLLWLHAPEPGPPPQGFDSLYFDEFEERGLKISELPHEEQRNHPAVYAGAVSLVDYWLGELLTGIAAPAQNEPMLVIIMAAEGHLWHRVVPRKSTDSAGTMTPLCDQCIRAPLLLRVLGDDRFQDFACVRSKRLVQTCDLYPTLLDWFGVGSVPVMNDPFFAGQSWLRELKESVPARNSLVIDHDGGLGAIRTSEWLCVRDKTTMVAEDTAADCTDSRYSLFAKPEDIWDVNNVASQQPELVHELWSHFPEN